MTLYITLTHGRTVLDGAELRMLTNYLNAGGPFEMRLVGRSIIFEPIVIEPKRKGRKNGKRRNTKKSK